MMILAPVRTAIPLVALCLACSGNSVGGAPDGGELETGDARLEPSGNPTDPADAAPPCIPGVSQLLANPGFEEGLVGWDVEGGNLILQATEIPITVHEGTRVLRMLFLNNAAQRVSQSIRVPPFTDSLAMTAWTCWATVDGSGMEDRVALDLVDSAGRVVESLRTASNAELTSGCEWAEVSFPIAEAHPGEELTVRFLAQSDNASYTAFYFDAMALTATVTCQ